MDDFQERVRTLLDIALDRTFNEVKHGGDHECRKLIAVQLVAAARSGKTSLDELVTVGRRAMLDFRNRSRFG